MDQRYSKELDGLHLCTDMKNDIYIGWNNRIILCKEDGFSSTYLLFTSVPNLSQPQRT